MKIKKIEAYEILDSRGNPTVKCRVVLTDGSMGEASVPSGASTGKYEALELRDGDPRRFEGKGVLKAVKNVNDVITPKLVSFRADEQEKIDRLMIDLDGTENKSKLGANAILSVSLAVSRAAADSLKMPLYRYLRELFNPSEHSFSLPIPMVKLFDGGKHANNNLDIQEFLILPIGASSLSEAVQMVVETFHHLGGILNKMGFSTTVGDEGGYAPNLKSNTEAMELMMKAIKEAGYIPGKEIFLALDSAATSFYKDKKYFLRAEDKSFSSGEMINFYARWAKNYPLISIEDGLSEDDWQGWQELTKKLGKKVQIVGDDLFVTNVSRIEKGIRLKAANATLIKFNQIGTLSETFAAIRKTYEAGWTAVISHRSGETEDTFMADLAVATNGSQIKTGVCRSERVAKYNRLLEIERELGEKAELVKWKR